jgi:predicted Zn-dependent peptidase
MNFSKHKLSNGMTLIIEQRELPIVSFGIANKFGAAYENSEIKGIAHFIEHLVFTGTKTRTHEDISKEIERHGGILNAYTSNEITCFWFKLPSEHLFSGAEIISDILVNPIFDEKKFEKEKKVILEEIKMYHDMPQRHIYDKIHENLYKSPFGEGIIGSEKTINGLSREFVLDYFKKSYSPENYVAVAVGKVDAPKLIEYLEKKFKKLKSTLKINKFEPINKETTEERAGLDQAHFIFGIHAPPVQSKEWHALEVLDAWLANGMSSRLFLTIREERGLAYSVSSSFNGEKSYSNYTIYVGTRKEAIPEVKKLILEGFQNTKNMTEQDLQQAKNRLVGLKKISMEESVSVMNELVISEFINKAEDYYQYEKEIQQVTLNQVKEAAKITKYSTASIVPK